MNDQTIYHINCILSPPCVYDKIIITMFFNNFFAYFFLGGGNG